MIEGLSAAELPVFIEVGPQQVLTRLNRRILAGRDVAMIGCDHPSRRPDEQLLRVQALLECLGLEMKPPMPVATSMKAVRAEIPVGAPVAYFDATAARRHRLKNQASSTERKPLDPPTLQPSLNGNGHQHREIVPPCPDVQQKPTPAPSNTARSTKTLEKFLVNFVVEQTGYPRDVVQLDADLEADLGIDSIKQAQLFGELREYFELPTTNNSSLMNCRTLGQIVQLLGAFPGKADWLASAPDDPPVDHTQPKPIVEVRLSSGRQPPRSRTSCLNIWCVSSWNKPATPRTSSRSTPIWKPISASTASRRPSCSVNCASILARRVPTAISLHYRNSAP